MRLPLKGLSLVILSVALLAGAAPASETSIISSNDLSRPFGTRLPWRFTASQRPGVPNPISEADKIPGAIQLCVSVDGGRTCEPNLQQLLTPSTGNHLFSEPHFLNDVRIVRPRADEALLLIQVASLHSGDGDQRVTTAVLAYDPVRDGFVPVFEKQTRRNNDQEVRYVVDGPLKGAIISAEPTNDAPFGFWITVNRLGTADGYKQILHYRSATRYGDGNPLAVIDSEMSNIEQHLGLWNLGSKLPLPNGQCRKPRLVHQELWC